MYWRTFISLTLAVGLGLSSAQAQTNIVRLGDHVSINGRVISGAVADTVKGNGQWRSDRRPLRAVDRLDVRAPLDVRVEIGDRPSLTVEADANILPLIQSHLRGGRLILEAKGSFETRRLPVVRITLPALEQVSLLAGAMRVDGLDNQRFRLRLEGSGEIRLEGRSRHVELEVTGAAVVDAANLHSDHLRLISEGASDIHAHASESLDATLNGASDIHIAGNPPRRHIGGWGAGELTFN